MFRYDGKDFPTQRALGKHEPITGRSLSQVLALLKDHNDDGDAVVELLRRADDLGQYGPLAREL
jgi:hypothetical protein